MELQLRERVKFKKQGEVSQRHSNIIFSPGFWHRARAK